MYGTQLYKALQVKNPYREWARCRIKDCDVLETEKFHKKDHTRLKEILDRIKGRFILSYNDCGYIRELYKNYNITEKDRMHNLVGDNRKPCYKKFLTFYNKKFF